MNYFVEDELEQSIDRLIDYFEDIQNSHSKKKDIFSDLKKFQAQIKNRIIPLKDSKKFLTFRDDWNPIAFFLNENLWTAQYLEFLMLFGFVERNEIRKRLSGFFAFSDFLVTQDEIDSHNYFLIDYLLEKGFCPLFIDPSFPFENKNDWTKLSDFLKKGQNYSIFDGHFTNIIFSKIKYLDIPFVDPDSGNFSHLDIPLFHLIDFSVQMNHVGFFKKENQLKYDIFKTFTFNDGLKMNGLDYLMDLHNNSWNLFTTTKLLLNQFTWPLKKILFLLRNQFNLPIDILKIIFDLSFKNDFEDWRNIRIVENLFATPAYIPISPSYTPCTPDNRVCIESPIYLY